MSSPTAEPHYPSLESINRNKLMDAAISCLQAMPLNKITMQHIAAKSGIVRQTVYNYYSNKNELLAAAFQREGIKMAEAVAAHIKPLACIEDKFVAGFVFVVQNFARNPILARVIEPGSDFLGTVGMTHYPFAAFGLLSYHEVFDANPALSEQAEEISELWVRNCLSLLTMPAAHQRSPAELADYVRRRLVPGLHLGDGRCCA
ncbi:MAG TPA: TetR/AcrR family transcriptional regulator [Pseudomonadales bacterium]